MSLVQGPADPAVLIFDPTRPMAGQTVQRLPAHPRGTFYPRAWSPDGSRLAGTIANTLVVYEPRSAAYTLVAEATPIVAAAAMGWLPDNRRLLAAQDRPDPAGRHRDRREPAGLLRGARSHPRLQPVGGAQDALRQPRARGSRRLDRHDPVAVGCSAPCRLSTVVPRLFPLAALAVAALGVTACQPRRRPAGRRRRRPRRRPRRAAPKASVVKSSFGTLADGTAVDLYTLTNANGVEMRVTTYGGIIVSLKVPDRTGALGDVVLGYNRVDDYVKDTPYFGAIVGRYGNRIGGATFTLDGKTYKLAANDGVNTLHGGLKGFDKLVWTGEPVERAGGVGVELSLTSKDGDEGYPGTLQMTVTYTLTDDNELVVDYLARTDKATPVNVTQHSYFNLAGEGVGTIDNHVMQIHADRYTPVAQGPDPDRRAGDRRRHAVRLPHADGDRRAHRRRRIRRWCSAAATTTTGCSTGRPAWPPTSWRRWLRVVEPTTGRTLEVESTEPGVQFYTGNFLDGHHVGKSNRPYVKRGGVLRRDAALPRLAEPADVPVDDRPAGHRLPVADGVPLRRRRSSRAAQPRLGRARRTRRSRRRRRP